MQSDFQEGWDVALEHADSYTGSMLGDNCGKISDAIQNLEDTLNEFKGYHTPTGQLSGNMAEHWHAGTFNINAAIKNSSNTATVLESNGLASVDIGTNWGEQYGLKFLRNADESAKAQAISWFQKYKEFTYANSSDISFEEYCKIKGISQTDILNDPIYKGQIRIIPSDQLEDAIKWLENKIAKEELTRPEQVVRYKETLENLRTVIKSPDGTTSVALTKEQAEELARLGKEGKVKIYDTQFCNEIRLQEILGRSLKAGMTAALITFVLKMAPEIFKTISNMVKEGVVDAEELKKVGLKALPATGESFLRGFVASSLTLAYETGKLGNMRNIKPEMVPSVIGALTVIALSTIEDSIKLANGKITEQEFILNLNRSVFVSGCAIGVGVLFQSLLPAIPFAYFIGNMVGTVVGALGFKLIDTAFVSLCVNHGYTFFCLVKQDYTLPEELLNELGVDWAQVDDVYFDSVTMDEVEIDSVNIDEVEGDYIKMLRRGVFKVHHVGYLYT